MPNPEKQVMSAQTLHKRPPKLHLGHEETASSADEINNSNDFGQCNLATVGMSSSPGTPTTPSTPSSPAISKPPKKRYLENGSFRCTGDDQNPSQMANLMELAKVCSNTTKASGSSFCNLNSVRDSTNKTYGSVSDYQTNVNCNYTQASSSALGDISMSRTLSSGTSSYNQIPIFDVDIAGRIRDSDLFETCSSSPSGNVNISNSRPEEPLNLCTDKKTITTCQQDLISRMVDKFFCDPNESKGTLLDSFLLRMNSHKKLPYCDKNTKTSSKSRDDTNSSDGEVECVGSYKTAKVHFNEKTGLNKNDKSVHFKNDKKDSGVNIADEEEKIVEQKPLQKKSQNNSSQNQNASSKMVTNSEKLQNPTDALNSVGDDYASETNSPSKEGQRKSQRSSKGKRYQAFLTEGFLHPLKERKMMRRNNSEEQIDCDKPVKEVEAKPVGKPNKKRKAMEVRDGKSATKEKQSTEDLSSREEECNGSAGKEENEAHGSGKARRRAPTKRRRKKRKKKLDRRRGGARKRKRKRRPAERRRRRKIRKRRRRPKTVPIPLPN
ncbi:micronuclear linker histone polyprotein-like [Centruroides vittatus]|uniref:micronuclear linker histone polyprotein-like n=1 Tax=Centruroides vittatus TaxID=120091 RepID=UPI00350EB2C0